MVSDGRSEPVASSGLVPSQAVSRRLRPSSTVPVMGCFPLMPLRPRARSRSTLV
jgi:hypothetical protein